ncbi:uncharacterized protein LOC115629964 [Scaptodrosophila lebanonensis]|uniref:Uncharacterized protein LOC115629964 n=1 Tax=Drosophila lebanonensis TaxID=7225 RepID=A0A6J2U180_DROLE|nr:uncharacterized protein LOC115629964 [Scaptodrosophila lebanonensis]XP_030382442.1 uncharacterized protein LOC115629964 [Scaptodrosophila lebanonensis]
MQQNYVSKVGSATDADTGSDWSSDWSSDHESGYGSGYTSSTSHAGDELAQLEEEFRIIRENSVLRQQEFDRIFREQEEIMRGLGIVREHMRQLAQQMAQLQNSRPLGLLELAQPPTNNANQNALVNDIAGEISDSDLAPTDGEDSGYCEN